MPCFVSLKSPKNCFAELPEIRPQETDFRIFSFCILRRSRKKFNVNNKKNYHNSTKKYTNNQGNNEPIFHIIDVLRTKK
jgi:hypothetical protein